jgi:U3 small nucleolar RNA-associated protein 14
MKFMQNSMEKQRLAALEKAKALLQDVEGSTKTKVTTNPDGKKRFGGKNISKVSSSSSSSLTKKEKEQVENLILESQTQASKTTTHRNQFDIPEIAVATDSNNPWLTSSQSSKAKSRTRTKAHEGPSRKDVITVEEDVVDVAAVANELEEKSSDKKDAVDQEQKSLIQQAFVGAGVNEEAFLKEKEKLIDRQLDDETVADPQMAGWGSWAGEGVTLSKKAKSRKRRKERRAELEKQDKRRKIESGRKDAGKKTVIISEKRDKKAAQFTVKQVPYPFKSRAQYEASLRRAIGGELNTSLVVDRETRPEVYTRAGVIITPARLPRRKFRT